MNVARYDYFLMEYSPMNHAPLLLPSLSFSVRWLC
jgi:hypothetical protein